MGKYFYCYSFRLKDFIKAFGIHYEARAINMNTGTPYFMFEKSEKLDAAIKLWNKNKAKLDNFDASPAGNGQEAQK